MSYAAVITAVLVSAGMGMISCICVLYFLWKVYDRGGRIDLVAAARSVRTALPGLRRSLSIPHITGKRRASK